MKNRKRMWIGAVTLLAISLLTPGVGERARADETAKATVEATYPGLATGVLRLALLTDMEKDVILKAYQIEITSGFAKEMLKQAPPDMQKELERNLFFLLEQKAMERLIKQDAVSMGISADQPEEQMLKAYVDRLTDRITVNETEVRGFYEVNKEMLEGKPFDQIRESIEAFLLQQKKVEALDARIQELGMRTDIRVNRDWVKRQAEMAMDNPLDRARMAGKPVLVQFWAAGCPPCEVMAPILDRVRKRYSDTLQVVLVDVGKNRLLGSRFGVRATPTQIFFDKDGEEVNRHEGLMNEADIERAIKEMGVS